MKSITGIEFNNPDVCIGKESNFACVCPGCMNNAHRVFKIFAEWLESDKSISFEELYENRKL